MSVSSALNPFYLLSAPFFLASAQSFPNRQRSEHTPFPALYGLLSQDSVDHYRITHILSLTLMFY